MPTYDDQNIFARILRGEIPCRTVYEDAYALAFHDIHPQAPIHILVIPKGKYLSAVDFGQTAPAEDIAGFYRAVSQIAKDHGLSENGFRLITNIGHNGGQEVPHYHVHLLGGKKIGSMVSGG